MFESSKNLKIFIIAAANYELIKLLHLTNEPVAKKSNDIKQKLAVKIQGAPKKAF